MASDNSTRLAPEPIPVEPVYFESPAGAPSIMSLILALEGVAGALEQEQIPVGDHDTINRVSCLGVAAYILASQLSARQTSKPLTKKQLSRGRKERAAWLEAREQLAGPAGGTA